MCSLRLLWLLAIAAAVWMGHLPFPETSCFFSPSEKELNMHPFSTKAFSALTSFSSLALPLFPHPSSDPTQKCFFLRLECLIPGAAGLLSLFPSQLLRGKELKSQKKGSEFRGSCHEKCCSSLLPSWLILASWFLSG